MKLGNIATFINGMAFKPEDWEDNGLPIIRIQNLTGTSKEFNYTNKNIDDKYIVEKNDILVSWSASLGVYKWNGEKSVLNQHIFKVLNNKMEINNDFLRYLLESKLEIMKSQVHGATMKHITKKKFDDIEVNIPNVNVQKEIAHKMNIYERLLDKEKENLKDIDKIIDNLFYDYFKNDILYGSKYELNCVSEIVTDGTHNTPEYTEESDGIIFLSSKDVTSKVIDWKNPKKIPLELHKILSKRITPRRDDILLAKNGTTGVAAIVDRDEIFDIYVSLCLIRVKPNVIPKFMLYQINSSYCKHQFNKSLKGVGVPNLHLNKIRETKVIIPDIEMQRKFVAEIEKYEIIRKKIIENIEDYEKLYKIELYNLFQ